jgi:dTDP-4-dehydrorhamnose reductase
MQPIDKFIITGVAGKIGSSLAKDRRVRRLIGIYNEEEPTNLKKGKYFQADLAVGLDIPENQEKDFAVVVHTAAKTHIDKCEKDRKNGREGEVWKSNVIATQNIIEFCRKNNKKLIFLSTECVFDGNKDSYKEDDKKIPINWYGETKSSGEKLVINSGLDYLIIRGVVAYGREKRLDDIVQLMHNKLKVDGKLKAVKDQRMNPTLVDDIVDSIFFLPGKGAQGIYHVAGSSVTTPYELAKKIAVIANLNGNSVKGLSMSEFFTKEKARLRLKNSVLDTSKYEKVVGIKTTSVDEGLKVVFESNAGF